MSHKNIITRALRAFTLMSEGTIAVAFGLLAPVLIGSVGVAMDLSQAYLVRQRLHGALDASALSAAAVLEEDDDEIEQRVKDFLQMNYPPEKIGFIRMDEVQVDVSESEVTVFAQAHFSTSFMSILGFETIAVSSSSTIRRIAGANIELALVLDISGSMNNNNKINDLKDAAKSLIDTVVYSNQTEYYSKIAIVPYGLAVNVGGYASAVRGSVATSPHATITGATKANPIVITAAGHGFSNDQKVFITGVAGMTQLNNKLYTVKGKTTNTFQLYNASGSSTVNGTSGYSTYTSGGNGWCATAGCQYYKFNSASGQSNKIAQINTCVSERTGTEAYTDVAPDANPVGRNYTSIGTSAMGFSASTNVCLTSTIVPLTSDKVALSDAIDAMTATGSTGGQVGVAWGWYMLSPNWGHIWSDEENVPAEYGTEELHKVMVLMTDGEYNSPHCNGMISADATSGSGSSSDHINCNSTNGNAYDQSEQLCDAMKDAGIEIYTVGFQVDAYPAGEALMEYCAQDAAHFFTADDGTELNSVFRRIAQSVSEIYLSR